MKDEIIEVEPKNLTPVVQEQHGAPAMLISQALSSNADLDKLQKLLDLQIQWEQNEARKAYMVAMAEFKKNPPDIEKDRKVDFSGNKGGRTTYNHASLANVSSKINKALGGHGLSAAWKVNQEENNISVTCTITHALGHSESTTLKAASDTSGNKNSIQAIGSTITYLERYTILALTGLATREMDDDGKKTETVYISEEQENLLTSLIDENDIGGEKYKESFLTYMKVESIAEIPLDKYKVATTAINAAIKAANDRRKGSGNI